MPNARFANQLRDTADRIVDVSRVDLQILLRRAALRLDNTSGIVLEPEVEDALSHAAAELKLARADIIRSILRDWLEANTFLPVRMHDEDGIGRA